MNLAHTRAIIIMPQYAQGKNHQLLCIIFVTSVLMFLIAMYAVFVFSCLTLLKVVCKYIRAVEMSIAKK